MITAKELIGVFWLGVVSVMFGVGWIVIGVDTFITQKFTPQLRLLSEREDITGNGARLLGIHMIANGGVMAVCGLLGTNSILRGDLAGVSLVNIGVISFFYALFVLFLLAISSCYIFFLERKGLAYEYITLLTVDGFFEMRLEL